MNFTMKRIVVILGAVASCCAVSAASAQNVAWETKEIQAQIDAAAAHDEFIVDYVRVWDEVD